MGHDERYLASVMITAFVVQKIRLLYPVLYIALDVSKPIDRPLRLDIPQTEFYLPYTY